MSIAGRADAPRTVLMFNGIGASIETALPFLAGFEDVRVIAFDVPGVGESPAPWLPYRLRRVARLARGLLDHLGVAQADVFGVSWGGAAAQEFAIRHPRALPHADAGRHLRRLRDGARPAARAAASC